VPSKPTAGRWRQLSVFVSGSQTVAAAALVEAATGVLPVIEWPTRHAGRRSGNSEWVVSAFVPASRARWARSRLTLFLRRAHAQGIMPYPRVRAVGVDEEDWAIAWKRFYRPSRVCRGLWVAPAWERHFRPPAGSRVVFIDPAMAFGTGAHPSTRLALRLLEEVVRPGAVVFDIGCGSGILGIAAAGKGACVYASDADPEAVRAARENFARNGVAAQAILCRRGVPKEWPRADVIAANISARVVTPLVPAIARHLRSGGVFVAGGMTSTTESEVVTACVREGMATIARLRSGEWHALLCRKKLRRRP
jgi:ribosomal protein L11 methyltransferase